MEENEQQQEQDGFENARAAFADEGEPAGAPNAVVEGEVAKAPEPPEPAAEPAAEPAKPEDAKKPDDFVKFDTPEQQQKFNNAFGYAKRLEREMQTLQQQLALLRQPVQPVVQPQAEARPQTFTEPRPKLADFETADQWGESVADWAARKAEHSAVTRTRQEYAQSQTERQAQEQETRAQQFLAGRTNEGYQKFGQIAFDNVCSDVVNFAPPGSVMNHALFNLQRYSDVVMELGKNLHEADRISRLSPHDQIYELKSLERKLIAGEELKQKAQTKIPTKVEAPGPGEDAKASPNMNKLKHAAYASGSLRDMAKIFEADQTL